MVVQYSRSALFDEDFILKEMPLSLRRKLVLELYKDVIDTVPFLSESRDNENLLTAIAQALTSYYAAAGEILLEKGQKNYRNLYIVRHGLIELSYGGSTVKVGGRGGVWNLDSCFKIRYHTPFTPLTRTIKIQIR